MTSYRPPDFNERTALSRQAKQKALEKLRAKPAATEEELAERKAARLARQGAGSAGKGSNRSRKDGGARRALRRAQGPEVNRASSPAIWWSRYLVAMSTASPL
jgi:hypothetical protein